MHPPPQVKSRQLQDFLPQFAAPASDRATPSPAPARTLTDASKFANRPREAKTAGDAPGRALFGSPSSFNQNVVSSTVGHQVSAGRAPAGTGRADGSFQRRLEPQHHLPESISGPRQMSTVAGNPRVETFPSGLSFIPWNPNEQKTWASGPSRKNPVEEPRMSVILNASAPDEKPPIPKARRITKKRVVLPPLE